VPQEEARNYEAGCTRIFRSSGQWSVVSGQWSVSIWKPVWAHRRGHWRGQRQARAQQQVAGAWAPPAPAGGRRGARSNSSHELL